MWQIINGELPFFYLKVEDTQYTLLDGLQYELGNTTALLRVDGTYLLGAYTFSGKSKMKWASVTRSMLTLHSWGC